VDSFGLAWTRLPIVLATRARHHANVAGIHGESAKGFYLLDAVGLNEKQHLNFVVIYEQFAVARDDQTQL
jgi:hypothetical protein